MSINNQTYVAGVIPVGINLGWSDLCDYKHDGSNPKYVAGAPCVKQNLGCPTSQGQGYQIPQNIGYQVQQSHDYPQHPFPPTPNIGFEVPQSSDYPQQPYPSTPNIGFQVQQSSDIPQLPYPPTSNIGFQIQQSSDYSPQPFPPTQSLDYPSQPFPSPQNIGSYQPKDQQNISGYGGSSEVIDQPRCPSPNDESNQYIKFQGYPSGYVDQPQNVTSNEPFVNPHMTEDNQDSESDSDDHQPAGYGTDHLPQSYDNNSDQNLSYGGEGHVGTMKPYPNFNAEQDCNVLRTAMKGIGTDEKSVIECLGRRNLEQRLEIKRTYKTMFGKDLIDCLKSELNGNFGRAVVESLYDPDYFDAYSLHKAMAGAGTNEDVLTEILTSRTNEEIEEIKSMYKKFFKKDLEKEIVSETSGFYKRVLVSCLQANKKELTKEDFQNLRQHGPAAVVDVNLANQEAAELYNAGEKKLGTDEAIFIKVFATRNKYQLRATFNAYEKISGHTILMAIDREMSGDLASALKAIALLNMNTPLYFASRLYKAMKGLGTNDTTLIRIILSRSEIDLENIKIEFQKQYNQTLEAFIKDDISGDYLKYILRFVQGN